MCKCKIESIDQLKELGLKPKTENDQEAIETSLSIGIELTVDYINLVWTEAGRLIAKVVESEKSA